MCFATSPRRPWKVSPMPSSSRISRSTDPSRRWASCVSPISLRRRASPNGPAAGWGERQLLVRQLLDDRKDKLAYALAAQRSFGESDVVSADLEFVSGWIALRRLNDPRAAYDHFARLYATVKLPVSLARGAYWAGRAADARGMPDEAGKWFAAAAAYATTYYGQLAAAHLKITPAPAFPAEPQPTVEERSSFERHEFVRLTRMLAEIGVGDIAKPFLLRLDATAKTPAAHQLVATLGDAAG